MARKVIFRTEASSVIGLGHLKRCLSLARAIKGLECVFAVSKETLELIPDLKDEFVVEIFPLCYEEISETQEFATKDDIIIVDSYDLASAWERKFKNNKLVVIDDLNREHKASIIIDQNFRLDYSSLYQNSDAKKLLGPQYALLDSLYYEARQKAQAYTERPKKLLISFGGSAQRDLILSSALALRKSFSADWVSELVVGPSLANDVLIKNLKSDSFLIVDQVPNLSEKLAESQLSLGAGGTMHWERCCLGVPSLTITLADNQKIINQDLADAGYIEYLGELSNLDYSSLPVKTSEMVNDTEKRIAMSKKCMDLVDGLGTKRVATEILAL